MAVDSDVRTACREASQCDFLPKTFVCALVARSSQIATFAVAHYIRVTYWYTITITITIRYNVAFTKMIFGTLKAFTSLLTLVTVLSGTYNWFETTEFTSSTRIASVGALAINKALAMTTHTI